MELVESLKIIKKSMWMIAAVTMVISLATAILSIFFIRPVYEGKAILIIGRASNNDNDRVKYDDILMYQTLVKTYSELAKSRLVIDEAVSNLEYDMTYEEIENKLKVTPKADTQILEIIVEDQSPERAAALANTLSEVFIEKVRDMMNSGDVKIMDKARIPQKPIKPKIILNIVLSTCLGIMLSISLVFLMEYLDNTLKSENDVEKALGISVLAAIPCTHIRKRQQA